MTENGDFQETDQNTLPALSDHRLIALADRAEAQVEAVGRIKHVALRLTNRHDWVDENGKPYLQASGAEKVARLFGISWRIFEPVKENLDGGHYAFTYRGEFSVEGEGIEAIGTRSSKDGFFKKYKGQGDDRVELPASEIDPGDVKKSAYTNLVGNGITRLLGIRNLTYEDLEKYAGIKKEDLASVQYKKGGKPVGQSHSSPGGTHIQEPDAPASEAQGNAILAILADKFKLVDELAKMEKIKTILDLKAVPTSVSKLTKGQASTVIQALNAEAVNGGAE